MNWHVLTPEFPPQMGGVADYVQLVARGLAEAGDEVHVWCPPGGRAEADDRCVVHPELGRLGRADLDRLGKLLDRFPSPRRLLVQWVPHGYGYRAMNVGFCFWLWKRARRGDDVEVMVHEPYLAFWAGTWRQSAAAIVHRVMTIMLLRAASRVWVAIPAWERCWRPYALGRRVPCVWLPIPSSLDAPDREATCLVRRRLNPGGRPLVGHFGSYGPAVAALLFGTLPAVLAQPTAPHVLLIGSGSEGFRQEFVKQYPQHTEAVRATGSLTPAELAAHIAACDLLMQPYPDGISCRRTTAMAGLRLGVPVVTTRGHLTESLWDQSRAVKLSDVNDARALVRHVDQLLEDPEERRQLGETGRQLYERRFALNHIVAALRAPRT